MITFKYTDTVNGHYDVSVEVKAHGEHLEAIVDSFRSFLTHIGHHHENVERVVYEEKGRQGLPAQLEMFLEDEE